MDSEDNFFGFKEYQALAYVTAGTHESDTQEVINWALGLAGEIGEIVDPIKKYAFHGHALDFFKIKDELGDLLWYLSALCTALGLNLEDIAAENLVKLAKRYPKGFTHVDSVNRVES